ncbi:hypothetical protein F2Q68_00006430 [Brassica cretica]|uniref:Uncharacterized protein n=1 Tax=Brassica cretica TaxID=69181 RepID=A0A8S9JBL7_BRACR|nr:hypothetical protein F2Q68_00006430 [Brassica cretica]
MEQIDGKLVVLVFFATPSFFFFLSFASLSNPSPLHLLRYTFLLWTSPARRRLNNGKAGVYQSAGGKARCSKIKRLVEPVGDLSRHRVHDVEAIVEVYSVARSVSLHSSAYGAFGSVSSSLLTWSVAGLCRFPTACFHTVKLKSLSRLAVVGIPGVGSVVWADAELGHLFRLMQLHPPAQGAL